MASAILLVAMAERALTMVMAGRGLETYRTFWLVEFNWVGLLVFLASVIVALLVGLVVRWLQLRRERQQWRQLEQNHGAPDTAA